MKGRSHAKIQAVLSKMKKRPKIRHKTVMLSAPQVFFFCSQVQELGEHKKKRKETTSSQLPTTFFSYELHFNSTCVIDKGRSFGQKTRVDESLNSRYRLA